MPSLESHKKFNLLSEIHRTAVYANEQHEIRWILIAFIILHTLLNCCSPEWADWNCNYHENELKSCRKCKNERSSCMLCAAYSNMASCKWAGFKLQFLVQFERCCSSSSMCAKMLNSRNFTLPSRIQFQRWIFVSYDVSRESPKSSYVSLLRHLTKPITQELYIFFLFCHSSITVKICQANALKGPFTARLNADDDDPIDMCSRLIVHTIWHAHRLGYE